MIYVLRQCDRWSDHEYSFLVASPDKGKLEDLLTVIEKFLGDGPYGNKKITEIANIVTVAALGPTHPDQSPEYAKWVERYHDEMADHSKHNRCTPDGKTITAALGANFLIRLHDGMRYDIIEVPLLP